MSQEEIRDDFNIQAYITEMNTNSKLEVESGANSEDQFKLFSWKHRDRFIEIEEPDEPIGNDVVQIDESCIECGKTECISIEMNTYCLICENCGVINGKWMTTKNEYSYSNGTGHNTAEKQRCNTIVNRYLPNYSINTMIVNSSGGNRYSIRRYRWSTGIPYQEKKLSAAFRMIKNNCHINLSTKIIDDAKRIYYETSMKITRDREGPIGRLAACTLIACNQNDVPRTKKEIAEIYGIKVATLTRNYNKLIKILDDLGHTSTLESNDILKSAADFVPRFCSKLGVIGDPTFQNRVINAIEIAEENGLTDGNAPDSIAASAILFIALEKKMKITKKDIERECIMSIATISKCLKQFQNNREFLI